MPPQSRLRTPKGDTHAGASRFWERVTIRRILKSDIYKAHTVDELRGIVSPEVLASLDSSRAYGLWYFGKNEVTLRGKGRNTHGGAPRANASENPASSSPCHTRAG